MSESLPTVFVIGSSTTVLIDPHLERMLSGVYVYSRKGREGPEVQKVLRDLDAPHGVGAGDSSMVLDYLSALDGAETFHPDVVLLHVGFHDIRKDPESGELQVPLQRSRTNVEEIVSWFNRRKIRLVWMRPGPLDEELHNERCPDMHRFEADLRAFNDAAEVVLKRSGIPVLDLAGFTERLGPMDRLLKDHVHFTDEVSKLQAAFIAGYLTASMKALPSGSGIVR